MWAVGCGLLNIELLGMGNRGWGLGFKELL